MPLRSPASPAPRRPALNRRVRLLAVGVTASSLALSVRAALQMAAQPFRVGHAPDGALGDRERPDGRLPAAPAPGRGELFFIDADVADPNAFWLAAPRGATVVCIPAGVDSWQFMAHEAENFRGLRAIHVISHGEPGAIVLNRRRYTAADLDTRAAALHQIGRALSKNGDILLYGCDTGEGAAGAQLVSRLAQYTGADIGASANPTGGLPGADWSLEVTHGLIDTPMVAPSHYAHELATLTVTSNADSGAGTLRNAIASAAAGDTIVFNAPMTITLSSGQLAIAQNVTIDGDTNGDGTPDVTIDGNYKSRVFDITSGNVTLDGLIVTHGLLAGNGANGGTSGGASAAAQLGAGIFNAGTLTLKDSKITANFASGGGGGGGGATSGGSWYIGGGGGGGGAVGGGFGGHGGSASDGTAGAAGTANTGGAGGSSAGGHGGTTAGGGGGSFYTTGGTGGTANNGTLAIGGGGGGGAAYTSGGTGGAAVGGIYNAPGGTVVVVGTSLITNNLGAGGGGGANGVFSGSGAAAGGRGIGAVWNKGTFHITASAYSLLSGNAGGNGNGAAGTTNVFNDGGTLDTNYAANTAPTFVGTTTTLAISSGAGATDVKSLLHVSDSDSGQTETWSQSTAPSHGTLTITSATAASGSTDITPGGTIDYTPTSGYSGSDSFTIQVSDGTATATRTISASVAASTNDNLASLGLSAGTLSPAFASGTTAYTAAVSNGTTSVNITPTVADATATVTVNGSADTSGSPATVSLNVGSNTITVVVTAADGTTTQTYTVTVTRALSSNADLADLTLSAGTLSPVFASSTTAYTAGVRSTTTSVDVTGTLSDPNATLTVDGQAATSGSPVTVSLNTGTNTLTIVDTAQDGTQETYTVTVTRAAAPTLSSATYDASSGVLAVSAAGMTAGDTIAVGDLTITGEGGSTYTLTSSNVTASGATAFTVSLNATDQAQLDEILNKNGTSSTGGTTYNLAAASGWDATTSSSADTTGNGITVSNVAVPTITSAAYDANTGTLTVTGTGFLPLSGAANDIVANKFTITGQGGATYTLTDTANVDITSSTSFTLTLSATDKTGANQILDRNGTSSTGGTTYNLAAAEDWDAGADVAVVIADSTANGITASNVDTAPVAGFGTALALEASRSEGVQVADNAALQFGTGSFTIEAWVKRPANNSSWYEILGKQDGSGGNGYYLRFNGNSLSFAVGTSSAADAVTSTNAITDGAWHHVAAVRDAVAKTVSIYVDGVLDCSATYTTAYSGTCTAPLGIGFKPNYGEYYDGSIDDVRIWNTARTAAQIKDLMNTPLAGTETGLVGYWNFEEGSGTSVADRSGHGLTGTIQNPGGATEWATGNIPYSATLAEDTPTALRLGGSDVDNQADATAVITALPAHGTLYQTNDGTTVGAAITAGTTLTDSGGNPRRLIYTPAANYNGADSFTYKVNDGSLDSANAETVALTVTPVDDAPVVTTDGGYANLTAASSGSATPVTIDSGLTISDVDNTTLPSATVAITGNFQSGEDVLAFTNTSAALYGNIVASYNAATGVLTLTSSGATATLSQFAAALEGVTYTDTSNSPNTATRTISFTVSDGSLNSSPATRPVDVTAVAPSAPTAVSATAGDGQATVSFTAPAGNGGDPVSGYLVTASPGGATATGSASPITITGLTNGTAYTFTVSAANSFGSSANSTASNAVTPQAPQSITFNNPGPQNFGTTPTLTATATSGLAVTFTSLTPSVATVTSGGQLTFVGPGTATIQADQAGNAAYLAAPSVTQSFTVAAVVPGAPTIGSATAADAKATVSFTPPAFTGSATITGFTVTSNPGGITGTGAASPITVTGLTNGTAYTFSVIATNSVGAGAASAASNAVTPMSPPVITSALTGSGTYGTPYAYTITATNSPTSYTATGLPTGLALDATTGAISGTPAQTGTFNVTLGATNVGGTDSQTLVLTVAKATLTVTGITAADKAYDGTTTATLAVSGAALVGVAAGDLGSVTLDTSAAAGTFADAAAGALKTVTISGLTVSGAATANYTLTQPTTTASIYLSFPISENFDGKTTSDLTAGGWLLTGNATTVNNALQLTAALNDESGAAIYNVPFSSSTGVNVQFDYYMGGGTHADGLSVFLLNGAQTTPNAGGMGGGLGYAYAGTAPGAAPGASQAYLGVGFDRYGNWANSTFFSGATGGEGATLYPNAISLRGPATASNSGSANGEYQFVANSLFSYPVEGTQKVNMTISPAGHITLRVSADGGTTWTTIYNDFDFAGSSAFAGYTLPSILKLGFAASTGGQNNEQTIDNVLVRKPADLGVSFTSVPSGTQAVGATVTYTLQVTSTGLNGDPAATLAYTVPAAVTGVTWNYTLGGTGSGGSGTGNTVNPTLDLPVGATATITVTGTAGSAAAGQTLANSATITPSAAFGDTNLADNTARADTPVYAAPVITSATTAAGTYGATFGGYTIAATNVPTSYGATGLPAGLSLDSTTGIISGTPTQAGNFPVTLSATNSAGTGTATLTLAVAPAALTVTANAAGKVYGDADPALGYAITSGALVSGDSLTGGLERVAGEAAGSYAIQQGTLTAGSNYDLTYVGATFTIATRTVTPSVTVASKVYDGTAVATITGRSLTGVLGADDVALAGGTATFATANVGATASVTGLTLTGTAAADYTLATTAVTTAATITPKTLLASGLAGVSKTYDGTTTAALSGSESLPATEAAGSGTAADGAPYTGDAVALTGTAVGTFDTKNVGTGKVVTVAGLTLNGAQAANYTLQAGTTTAAISGKTLTVTGLVANNKVYDGTTTATLASSGAALSGVAAGDQVTLGTAGATATFADANAGNGKAVTVAGLTLAGADAGNYLLTQPTLQAAITPAPVTLALSGLNQTYDGTAKPVVVTATPNEPFALTYAGQSAAPVNAGSYAIVATITDPNYSGSANGTLVIAKASQTLWIMPVGSVQIDVPVSLYTSASSGGAVVLSLVSGNAVLSGSTLTVHDANPVIVRGVQAGSANYAAATTEVTIEAAAKLAQAITFAAVGDHHSSDAPFTLAATASSGLPVTFSIVSGPAMLSGSTLTLTGALGPVTVRASQHGNAVYNPAPDVDQTFTVTPVGPFVYFGTLGAMPFAASLTPDGKSGTMIGTLPGSGAGFVATFTPGSDGSWVATTTTFTGAVTAGTTAAGGATPERIRAADTAAATLTFHGTVSGDTLTGTIDGLNLTFTAQLEPSSGPTAPIAGYYESASLDTASGTIYSVIGSQGDVYALAVTPGFVGGSTGTVSDAGAFKVGLASDATLNGSVDATTTRVTGTLTLGSQSPQGFAGVAGTTIRTDRLMNLSSRAMITGAAEPLISGFVVSGPSPKPVLLRAVGPSLASFGMKDAVGQVQLRLFTAAGRLLRETDGGGDDPTVAATSDRVGAFPLVAGAGDSAMVVTLDPGSYTMEVVPVPDAAGNPPAPGVGMAEVYDASTNAASEYQRLINISSRGTVAAGDGALIGGFVVNGNAPKRVLIRGVGPALAKFGVGQPLADPTLTVYAGNTVVAKNAGWGTPVVAVPGQAAATPDQIAAAAAQVGAFGYDAGSQDSALIVTLPPGVYTAVVGSATGGTGTALVEVYELPAP